MGKFIDTLSSQLGGGLGSLVNTGLGLMMEGHEDRRQIRQQQKLQDMQIAGSKEMTDYNYQKQLNMWHDTNYGAQMKELKNAGLNAGLIYGMSGGGATTTGSGSGANVSGGTAVGHTGEILGIQQLGMQNKLLEAQIENIEADTQNKIATNPNIQADTGVKTETIEQLKAQTNNIKAQQALTEVQTGISQIQKSIQEQSEFDQVKMFDLAAQKIQQEVFQLQNNTEISDQTKKDIVKTIKANAVNAVLEQSVKKAGIALDNATINKLSQDIIQKGQEIDIRKFEANLKALYPSVHDVEGSMLNSIKIKIDKLLKLDESYTKPIQLK